MPIERLSFFETSVLCWLAAELQRSQGLLAAHYHKLVRGFSRAEQQRIRQSVEYLETKGLIDVRRSPAGKPAYLALTPEGHQCFSQMPWLFSV
jgi:DNA-binding MarR family transcriptional regulator